MGLIYLAATQMNAQENDLLPKANLHKMLVLRTIEGFSETVRLVGLKNN
jgi:hypothetical protein